MKLGIKKLWESKPYLCKQMWKEKKAVELWMLNIVLIFFGQWFFVFLLFGQYCFFLFLDNEILSRQDKCSLLRFTRYITWLLALALPWGLLRALFFSKFFNESFIQTRHCPYSIHACSCPFAIHCYKTRNHKTQICK